MSKQTQVTFYGGVGSVTGSNFLIEGEGYRALVDCGMFQGTAEAETKNYADFPYDVKSIDFLFITHAHMDHIGRIPLLVKAGFSGIIYSTPETKNIAELMLADAARIMDFDSQKKGIPPKYSPADVHRAMLLWKTISYHSETKISQNLSVVLKDAGHILGSSMYLFTCTLEGGNTKKILFTGDLGNSPSLLLPDTEFVTDAHYIVMDSVYGDRNHEPKEVREERFKEAILKAIERKGTLIIPTFSLERAQTILYQINNWVEGGAIPQIPVFLDSPLAIELTEIYEKVTSLYNKDVQKDIAGGDKIFEFPKLKETARSMESRKIHETPDPKIIIAGSGMSTAGRVLHHETRYLPDANTTLLLMGYQAPGTLGRELQEGNKHVYIDGAKVEVKAKVEMIDGYSAHKDSDHLVEFVEHAQAGPLQKVFVVMGEPKSSLFLVQRLRDELGVTGEYPAYGKPYPLS